MDSFNLLLLISLIGNVALSSIPGNTYADCFPRLPCANCRHYKGIFRRIDGTCNNEKNVRQGAANMPLLRLLPADYADKVGNFPRGFPGTSPIPTANEVAAAVFTVSNSNKKNVDKLSVLFMTFGQFLDHDLSESPHMSCTAVNCSSPDAFKYPCFPIQFTPGGETCTIFTRSESVCQKRSLPRNQVNTLTAYIDGSAIYSTSFRNLQSLRKQDGSGELKITADGLLPIARPASDSSCSNPVGCSLVGDSRGDENIALSSMHTIWLRHHNLIAKRLRIRRPQWSEDRIFLTAKKINSGILQHIVYKEFVPHLVNLRTYRGYRANVDATIANVFSTAAYRFGHSLVPNSWEILDKNFNPIRDPEPLQRSFFNSTIIRQDGIEGVVYGLLGNQSQEVDTTFAFGIARRLFVPFGDTEYEDLTARNIQRGRDHGIPTYGAWRKYCKLPKLNTFDDLDGLMPVDVKERFRILYKHPDDIDLFAAGIAEYHTNDKILGDTFQCIIKNQFERLRDGDSFYYERENGNGVFTKNQRDEIKKMSMARVLCDTLVGIVSIQRDAFMTAPDVTRIVCDSIPKMNINRFL